MLQADCLVDFVVGYTDIHHTLLMHHVFIVCAWQISTVADLEYSSFLRYKNLIWKDLMVQKWKTKLFSLYETAYFDGTEST